MPLDEPGEAATVTTVVCSACGHPADIAAPSSAWKCNCAAGVSADPDCVCDALNQGGAELNPPDTAAGEIAELDARLLVLKGEVDPEGDVQNG